MGAMEDRRDGRRDEGGRGGQDGDMSCTQVHVSLGMYVRMCIHASLVAH